MPEAPAAQPRRDRSPNRSFRRRIAPGHVVMVVSGLVAFLLTYAVLRDDTPTVALAVAATGLSGGEPIDASMVDSITIPLGDRAVPGGLLRWEEAEAAVADGLFVAGSVPAGSLLRADDLAQVPVERPRAMALAVDRSQAVDGVLAPGDVVDIVMVEQGVARFALVGVPVLAATDPGAGRGIVVTVEVDAVGSLRLAHALGTGTIRVVRSTHAAPADPEAVYPAPAPLANHGGSGWGE